MSMARAGGSGRSTVQGNVHRQASMSAKEGEQLIRARWALNALLSHLLTPTIRDASFVLWSRFDCPNRDVGLGKVRGADERQNVPLKPAEPMPIQGLMVSAEDVFGCTSALGLESRSSAVPAAKPTPPTANPAMARYRELS